VKTWYHRKKVLVTKCKILTKKGGDGRLTRAKWGIRRPNPSKKELKCCRAKKSANASMLEKKGSKMRWREGSRPPELRTTGRREDQWEEEEQQLLYWKVTSTIAKDKGKPGKRSTLLMEE